MTQRQWLYYYQRSVHGFPLILNHGRVSLPTPDCPAIVLPACSTDSDKPAEQSKTLRNCSPRPMPTQKLGSKVLNDVMVTLSGVGIIMNPTNCIMVSWRPCLILFDWTNSITERKGHFGLFILFRKINILYNVIWNAPKEESMLQKRSAYNLEPPPPI